MTNIYDSHKNIFATLSKKSNNKLISVYSLKRTWSLGYDVKQPCNTRHPPRLYSIIKSGVNNVYSNHLVDSHPHGVFPGILFTLCFNCVFLETFQFTCPLTIECAWFIYWWIINKFIIYKLLRYALWNAVSFFYCAIYFKTNINRGEWRMNLPLLLCITSYFYILEGLLCNRHLSTNFFR